MQILILSGSRNPEGRTGQAINAIRRGVANAGGNTESFFLPELSLECCRQCESDGWGVCRQEGRCIIEDDFSSLVDKIKSSDVVVFASPVYFADLSESMRVFLDRFRRYVLIQQPSLPRVFRLLDYALRVAEVAVPHPLA